MFKFNHAYYMVLVNLSNAQMMSRYKHEFIVKPVDGNTVIIKDCEDNLEKFELSVSLVEYKSDDTVTFLTQYGFLTFKMECEMK